MQKRIITTVFTLLIMIGIVSAILPPSLGVAWSEEEINYLDMMYQSAKEGSVCSLRSGAMYEKQRNDKIMFLKMDYEPTFFFTGYQDTGDIVSAIENYIVECVFSSDEVEIISEVVFAESRGIESLTEQACVIWCVLNRVDAGYGSISAVITAPNQFARKKGAFYDDYNRDIRELAKDVLFRWHIEKSGEENVGRVLPKTYLYFGGDGKHNYFRESFRDFSKPWDYSLGTPYEN